MTKTASLDIGLETRAPDIAHLTTRQSGRRSAYSLYQDPQSAPSRTTIELSGRLRSYTAYLGQGAISMLGATILSCPVCWGPLCPDNNRCDCCGSVALIERNYQRLDRHSLNMAVTDAWIAEHRTAIQRDSRDATAHYGLGIAYFNLGLLDEAADCLDGAARLTPENPHVQRPSAVGQRACTAGGEGTSGCRSVGMGAGR